ncbi:MAG: hypothetical protein PHP98_11160 [Kiritimatiellae bacterium]|jgi:hypothetical protein|nr:hypothetical protein [Kiritimatiellia bacterium]
MVNTDPNECRIPTTWRNSVIGALESDDKLRVIRKPYARHGWFSKFPDTWEHQWNNALIAALSNNDVIGRHITDMKPPCDAYAFWFTFDGVNMYGKIGLLSDGHVIIIFSSHQPRKGENKL